MLELGLRDHNVTWLLDSTQRALRPCPFVGTILQDFEHRCPVLGLDGIVQVTHTSNCYKEG